MPKRQVRPTTNALDEAYAALSDDTRGMEIFASLLRGAYYLKDDPAALEARARWADQIEAKEAQRKAARERLGAIIERRDAELKQGK